MKTTSNKAETGSIWASFKTAFYAFQVIVIAIAIPTLSYLEMSYDTKPAQEQTSQKELASIAPEKTIALNK